MEGANECVWDDKILILAHSGKRSKTGEDSERQGRKYEEELVKVKTSFRSYNLEVGSLEDRILGVKSDVANIFEFIKPQKVQYEYKQFADMVEKQSSCYYYDTDISLARVCALEDSLQRYVPTISLPKFSLFVATR